MIGSRTVGVGILGLMLSTPAVQGQGGSLYREFQSGGDVASVAAFQPAPFMAVYAATKAYVLSFSEALSEELRGTGVRCSALCPGPVQTTPALRTTRTTTRRTG